MMIDSPERNEFVMTLASEAQKMSPGERDSFLQSACQNDPELYRAVSDVVAWEERMSGFLDHPLIEFIDLETLEEIFDPGETVSGRFDILRRMGEVAPPANVPTGLPAPVVTGLPPSLIK